MTTATFLRALTASLCSRPTAHRRCRLSLEVLEDRFAPAVFNVNTLADTVAVNLATGQDATGHVSLRSALLAAAANPGGNTINLTIPGTYRITRVGTVGETDGIAGELTIAPTGGDLTIRNTSAGVVTVDGGHLSRVLDVNPNFNPTQPTPKYTVTLSGFTIQNGLATDPANPDSGNASGGGIRVVGNASLTLNNVVVTNNTATADGGGVVFENTVSVPWTLTVNNSVISNNHAGDAGGGIDTDGSGKVFINAGTVITGNTSVNQGAGIWLDAIQVSTVLQTANLTITGAVISNNTAVGGLGGGVGNAGLATVTITGSTIANNSSGATGGGFGDENAQGTLVVQNSLFLGNSALNTGGGIAAGGPATSITGSEIKGNSSGGNGGGLFANGTTLTVRNSTVAGNSTPASGGGLEIETSGSGAAGAIISNTTIFDNSALNAGAGGSGGGIAVGILGVFSGSLLLLQDTINGNFASLGGGLEFQNDGTVNLENTILAGNHAAVAGPDFITVNGTHLTSLGGNVVGVNNNGDATFTQPGDQTGTAARPLDPLLGPLQNNGGPTIGGAGATSALETEALLPGSPAVGKGVATVTSITDERGFLPTKFVNGGAPDVGAFQSRIGSTQVFSTVPGNGDVNPYGVAFVPANFPTGGVLQPGDLLLSNFNNAQNVQGTGTTITRISVQGQTSTFFTSPLPGLSDALGILQAGFVVVGNVPNVNGTPQAGALQFLDQSGKVVLTLTDHTLINGPWSLLVANDTGATAQVFVSNVLSGTVSRFNLQIQNGQITVASKVQIASGYGHRLDNAAFVVGPAGLVYDTTTLGFPVLYVASSADNEIFYVPFANTRVGDFGPGVLAVNDPVHLHGPLGLTQLPNGNLLTANSDAQNVDPNQPSELVEYTVSGLPVTATFVRQFSVDPNNGGAFGLGLTSANGQARLAAVNDNTNTITVWSSQPTTPLPDLTLVHTSDPYQLVVNVANPTNAPLTYSATVLSPLAEVARKFGLVYTGDYFQGFAGINGKWLQSNNGSNAAHGGWYFLLADGTLHQWDGGTTLATAATSPSAATFNPSVYTNPLPLASAAVAGTAFAEEQALDLVFAGNYFQNFAGINGKWLQSGNGSNAANGGWYFVLPDGTVHQWDGGTSRATTTTSPTVATLNGTYWQSPSLLYQATPAQTPDGIRATFLGSSNVLQFSGYKNFLGTFGIEVAVNNGTSTTVQDFLVKVTDQAPTVNSVPNQTVVHTGSLTIQLNGNDADPGETLTYKASLFTATLQTQAATLRQQLGLTFTGDYFQSFAGINGKWLQSTNGSNVANGGWYFLLSDGTLHQWDGGSTSATATSSPLVATLDPTYYADPTKLLNALPTPPPAGLTATVDGNTVTFGNFGDFTGQLVVVATATDGILSAATTFHIIVT